MPLCFGCHFHAEQGRFSQLHLRAERGRGQIFRIWFGLAKVLEMDITFVGRDHRNEIRHLYEATVKPGMKSPHPVNVGDLALLACYILEGQDKTEAIMTKKKPQKCPRHKSERDL